MKALQKALNAVLGLFQSTFFNVVMLFVLTGSITVIAYNRVTSEIPATYPDVKPLIQGQFQFMPDRITVHVSETPLTGRLLVFAYDEQGNQWTILKPVYNNVITVTSDEEADFKVYVSSEGDIQDHEFLKGKDETEKGTNFYRLLLDARTNGYKYGVQECFYPLEERCADVCPVRDRVLITFHVLEDGRIGPKIDVEGCPRTGLCIHYCPQGIIRNVAERILEEGDATFGHRRDEDVFGSAN